MTAVATGARIIEMSKLSPYASLELVAMQIPTPSILNSDDGLGLALNPVPFEEIEALWASPLVIFK